MAGQSDIDLPVLEVFSDGTYRSRIADPAAAKRMRRQGAVSKDIPGIDVRVIEYSVSSTDGSQVSETFTLVTDILDPQLLTPQQAAGAYASRWQLETCFNELETSIRGGAAVVLRSKSPVSAQDRSEQPMQLQSGPLDAGQPVLADQPGHRGNRQRISRRGHQQVRQLGWVGGEQPQRDRLRG